MVKNTFIAVSLLFLLAGCYIRIGDRFEVRSLFNKKAEAKVRWEEEQSIAFAPETLLRTKTAFGKITVTGADVNECHVHAVITAQAPHEEKAQEIADQVSLRLQPEDAGKTLVVTLDKPKLPRSCSVFATYHITLPQQAHLYLETSFGAITLKNTTGTIWAKTSHGEVRGEDLTGSSVELRTSFGKTSHGPVIVDFTSQSSPTLQAQLETSFGEIKCTVPPSFA
ncbi:hypothetical protein ACFL6U_25825, partial [Planctomycetota bacterium]